MIESITLKNVATYDQTDGVQLDDLKKLNFFFGFNGSGKSTIAKFLYNLSVPIPEKLVDFNNCTQSGFDPTNEQILVFDENFTEINFNKNPLLKGVFSLNQQNTTIDSQIKDQEELIKSNNINKERKEALKNAIEADKNKNNKALLDNCWSKRNSFSTFTKISLAYSGSKPNHLDKIKRVLQTIQGTVPTIQELSDEYRRLYEKDLSIVKYSVNRELYRQVRKIESELSVILNEIIIGNEDVDISALIKTINARNWIETGIEYLKQTGNICPFCQQETIDEKLTKQFNELFDETYKKKIERISSLLAQYKKSTSDFTSNILEIQNDYNQDNITSNLYLKLQELFNSNYATIEEKIKNSNERKTIPSILNLKPELSKLIKAVNNNNKTFSELDKKRNTLTTNIWKHMADSCKNQITIFKNKEKKIFTNKLHSRQINTYIQKQYFNF